MNKFDIYITCVFIVKIIFILLVITHKYIEYKYPNDLKKNANILSYKEETEFLFIIMMSLLLIYLFNPRKNRLHMIDRETTILFYVFGFVLILTAKWEKFITTSVPYKYFTQLLQQKQQQKQQQQKQP